MFYRCTALKMVGAKWWEGGTVEICWCVMKKSTSPLLMALPQGNVTLFCIICKPAPFFFFFFFLVLPPSLPCCSDIRQGNSSEISSATPSAKVQKIRVSHFGSSLTVLRPPASSSFRGVPSASTINAFIFPSTRLNAFFCAGPAQHKSQPCVKAPS